MIAWRLEWQILNNIQSLALDAATHIGPIVRNVSRIDTLVLAQSKEVSNIINYWLHKVVDGGNLHQSIDQPRQANAA